VIKAYFLIFIALTLGCFASSKDLPTKNLSKEEAKTIQKESKKIGKEGNQKIVDHLKSLYENKTNLKSMQDSFLAKEEEGKTFDRKAAKSTMEKGVFPSFEVEELLTVARSNAPIDENEEMFLQAKAALDNGNVEITSMSTKVPEEEVLETCVEGGVYARVFEQQRLVTIIPEALETFKVCKGHVGKFLSKFPTKKSLNELKTAIKKNIGENIELKNLEIDGRHVCAFYAHKNPEFFGAANENRIYNQKVGCFDFKTEEKIVSEKEERDDWVLFSGNEKTFKDLESDTDCTLLKSQPLNPGTKTINNTPVYRDSWKRRLVFSCSPKEESKCSHFRNLGATMVKKHCLKTSDDGECLKWEKTFDLGKRAAFEKHVVNFDQEALDYLDVFNNGYEKNTEFGQAISTLAAFSDMKAFDDGTKAFDPKLVSLFSGEEKKCRRSLNSKNLFDCCYKETFAGRGIFTHLGDLGGNCSKEEKDLYLAVSEGRCKKVGKIPQLLETKHVYCCFPTKLSKIVQEAGRKQLGEV